MKQDILKSKLASSFLLAGKFVDAQIVYTDIIPDSIIAGDDLALLDLNNDGTFDFKIHTKNFAGSSSIDISKSWSAFIKGYSNNEILDVAGGFYPYVDTLNLDDSINAQQVWASKALLGRLWEHWNCWSIACSNYTFFSDLTGSWQDVTDRFAGLKLIVASDTLYGWVRMDVSSLYSVKIKDYAYDTIPNEPILAGDSGDVTISINSIARKTLQISPNPATTTLQLNLTLTAPSPLIITDALGRVVKEIMLDAAATHTIISTADLVSGVYFLTVTTPDHVFSSKLVIEK